MLRVPEHALVGGDGRGLVQASGRLCACGNMCEGRGCLSWGEGSPAAVVGGVRGLCRRM